MFGFPAKWILNVYYNEEDVCKVKRKSVKTCAVVSCSIVQLLLCQNVTKVIQF